MKKKWLSLLLVAVFLSSCSDEVPERRRKDYGEASAPIAGNVSVTASIVNKVDSAEFRKLMIDGLNEGAKALPNVQFKIESLN